MNNTKSGILDQAKEWQLEVYLDRKLRFPCRDCTNKLKTGHGFVVGSDEEDHHHHRVDRPLGREVWRSKRAEEGQTR